MHLILMSALAYYTGRRHFCFVVSAFQISRFGLILQFLIALAYNPYAATILAISKFPRTEVIGIRKFLP